MSRMKYSYKNDRPASRIWIITMGFSLRGKESDTHVLKEITLCERLLADAVGLSKIRTL
jgi:hypothetical protein